MVGFRVHFCSQLQEYQLHHHCEQASMSKVLLIYPYFRPPRDRSVFRFPPLGISYLASSLMAAGHDVRLLDCTFTQKPEALEQARQSHTEVVGIYCMVTMLEDCLWLAR